MRTRDHRAAPERLAAHHRFIRRDFCPEDLASGLRPFVFNYIHGQIPSMAAVLAFIRTLRRDGDVSAVDRHDYEDTHRTKGVVRRGIEYVQAGERSVAPGQPPIKQRRITGFSALVLSLPPELEDQRAGAEYLPPPEAVRRRRTTRCCR